MESTKLVADVAVVADDRVLFVRYRDTSKYDGQRGWFLPDDFLVHGEHPDTAARRILGEQAGIDAQPTLAEIESFANGAWHLIFHFVARVNGADSVEPRGNVADARWFPLSDLPAVEDTAHHGWGLDVLVRVLT